jgi:hypothetical protein
MLKDTAIQKNVAFFENKIDVLKELSKHEGKKEVFSSNLFKRSVLERGSGCGCIKIIEDFFPQKQLYLYYFSFSPNEPCRAKFDIKADYIRKVRVSGRTGIFIEKQNQFFLIPNLPTIRSWDKKRHIVYERPDYYAEYRGDSTNFLVDFLENESFDFIVLSSLNEDIFAFLKVFKDINKEYTVTGPWVVVLPFLDCWRFMIDGKIYEYRENIENYTRFTSQQAALFLYKLIGIEKKRAEAIASVIRDEIAYSVLLDLEPDGRWIHGCWSDEMETHTRFQVDGIHLLLDHFEETKEPLFLEKALLAANYLLTLTDTLKDEAIWFLHDTLEFGKHYIYPMIKSRAFDKSETNTLCLNTHLSALCALIRLYNKTKEKKLKMAIERGLKAAEMVLKAEPATNLYRVLYYLVDLSFDRPSYGISKKFPASLEALKILLGKSASSLLPHVKRVFPRFLMPNGLTTRHLSLSHESFSYHIINLYDMLVLYQLLILSGYRGGLEWLWKGIDKAVKYCFKGHLIGFLIRNRDRFIPQLVEALIMYGAFNNEFDKKDLINIVLTLKDNGYRFTSGSYGFDNLVTPKEYQISELSLNTYSPDIEPFNTSPRGGNFKELLLINTGPKKKQIDIEFKESNKRLEIVSSGSRKEGLAVVNGKKIKPPLFLDPRDYLMVRIYDI